jgi:hypothetical protein
MAVNERLPCARGPRRRRGATLAAAACSAAASFLGPEAGGRIAAAAPDTVGVLAPPGSRLADELARELGTSMLLVVRMNMSGADWRQDVDRLWPDVLGRGIAIGADDRQVIVFTREPRSGVARIDLELAVDRADQAARRRACLTVVEYLRVADPQDGSADGSASSSPARRARAAEATAAGAGSAVWSSVSPPAFREAPLPASASVGAATPGPPRPPVRAQARVRAYASASAAGRSPETAAEPGADPDLGLPWAMGVASTLGFDSTPREPMAHVQFAWWLWLSPGWALRLNMLWPLLGAHMDTDEGRVRMWTFGGSVGLQADLREAPARLRPFVSGAIGTRLILTDPDDPGQGGTSFTPGVDLGVRAGIRYLLAPRVQPFIELETAKGMILNGADKASYQRAAANAVTFYASVGALFEY